MSSLIAAPELITTAATDLANIGSAVTAANAAATAPTTGVLAAAEDEVSAAIAAVFSAHGQGFQALSAQAAAFHEQFVQALTAGAGSYASAEAANVAAFTANPAPTIGQDLQSLAVFSPVKDLTGRPLLGNGVPGTGQAGGWIIGNGGTGGLLGALGINGAAAFHQPFMQPLNAIAGSMGGGESRFGALLIPPGQLMHDLFLPGTRIENPFFGVPPGLVKHTEFIPGTRIENPLFGVPPGHWDIGLLIQALSVNNGAAAFHQPFGALLNAFGHIPPGQLMHDLFLPGTRIENPFFGVPPGLVKHTEFIPGTRIENPLFGVPPGHWDISLLIQALSVNNGAAASGLGSGGSAQSLGNLLLSALVSNIPGVQQTELIFDAEGPLIVTQSALANSGTAFVNAVQTGNLGAATTALVDAPTRVGSAFLYGHDTVTVQLLSSQRLSLTLDVPVGGVLAPLQPISATVATTGNPPTTFPIPGTEVGGIVPALTSSLLGGGGLLGGGLLGGGLLGGGLLGGGLLGG